MKIKRFNENIIFKDLNYVVDESVFKERGYNFQKLYAANYPVFNKKLINILFGVGLIIRA